MVMLIRVVPLGWWVQTATARAAGGGNRAVDRSHGGAQAGATCVVALVLMVFQPSTSSGLRGSGPM